jgi:endonuclease/exonuclease/phosphatase family metal-dependent hydrolase
LKKFFLYLSKKIGWLSFVATVVLYLLTAYANYLNPSSWWWLHILAYGFPILMVILLIWAIVFLWRKKTKAFLITVLAFIITIPVANKVVGFKFYSANKKKGLSVLSWNIARFGYGQTFNINFPPNRAKMVEELKNINADIMCLQEFWFVDSPKHRYNHFEYIRDSLNYPYILFTNDFTWSAGSLYGGNIIFSKYPIVSKTQEKLFSIGKTEDLGIADIKVNNQTVRLVNFHLRSNKLSAKEVNAMDGKDTKIIQEKKVGFVRGLFRKLRQSLVDRPKQAAVLNKVCKESPYPVISCGDFNDVPNSYSYRVASDGLHDAFLEKRIGWGRTFKGISPTLRIDYMFYGKDITCNYFERINKSTSDHMGMLGMFEIAR